MRPASGRLVAAAGRARLRCRGHRAVAPGVSIRADLELHHHERPGGGGTADGDGDGTAEAADGSAGFHPEVGRQGYRHTLPRCQIRGLL